MIENGFDLRIHRRTRNVELKVLAGMLDINPETLRDIEREKMPAHPDVLRRAEQILSEIRPRRAAAPVQETDLPVQPGRVENKWAASDGDPT